MLLAAVCVLLLAGGVALGAALLRQEPAPPRVPASAAGQAPGAPASPSAPSSPRAPGSGGTASAQDPAAPRPTAPVSPPTRLVIPSLRVSTSLERLALDENHVLGTPRDPDEAGWYARGAAPGARGPAVIAGHVTWNGKKAVFFDLARLRTGQRVEVRRSDGGTAVFSVTRITQYPKDRFPSLEVYGNTPDAQLRLITCGGEYSRDGHHYSDNVVVYARLVR
ncbi:class F sortase [Streptomyces sp. NPDC007088]|uniref:class F sortase n=1 Tax=Streptomyces sp. NPDC007088 TaxID=3364773 RepID=UPI0036792F86